MNPGALSFAAPAILAALIALPAIWLLLRATPPAPAVARFPAFAILKRLAPTQQTPARTPWWVLVLRLLVAALAILGLAGPVLNAPPSGEARGPLILIVDDTFAAASGWRLRRDAIARAAEEVSRDRRTGYLIATAPQNPGAPAETPAPLTAEGLRNAGAALQPQPFRADRAGALARLEEVEAAIADGGPAPEIRWLSDGLAEPGDDAFIGALAARAGASAQVDPDTDGFILRPRENATGAAFRVDRLNAAAPATVAVAAFARDGRELARGETAMAPGVAGADIDLDLPLALRNEVSLVRIEGVASAGAVFLADARARRALVGMTAESLASDALLSGAYYVRQALAPHADLVDGAVEQLVSSDATAIVLDDVARLRPADETLLTEWIERGGVLIRFAGPVLADAADSATALMPAPLRSGDRALGGALSWETPQSLGDFSADGPFARLDPPADVRVRRQVLATPGGETSLRIWASLGDGTPLVTGERRGAGVIALFHVTATPEWSDLPLSGAFVEMLRSLIEMSAIEGAAVPAGDATARLAPLRMLDGFGTLNPPGPELQGVSLADADLGPAPGRPPGHYGAPAAPVAINTIAPGEAYEALAIRGLTVAGYDRAAPVRLAAPIFALALALLVLDGLVALWLAGAFSGLAKLKDRVGGAGRTAASLVLLLALASSLHLATSGPAGAQDNRASEPPSRTRSAPLDAPIDPSTSAAALRTRLAYVVTGDPGVDRISAAGLANLSRELTRRTALEPAPPAGVDPETDDLSIYPLIYWPMTAGVTRPSDAALANIEAFMRFGGLIIFDTRDDERAIAGVDTPERSALQTILRNIDTPPLEPVPADHVLKRSFYLLDELPGRLAINPVWVQAGPGPNDSVTPLIIGGRDWAGAWATNDDGLPMLPIARGGERGREYAIRTGINMTMVALTGNYKSDQVHTPVLLQRLGR